MLIDFKITNFRSFHQEVDFSMEAGSRLTKFSETNLIQKDDLKLTKSALLFGGNANGKTNLIKALQLLQYLVMLPTMNANQNMMTDTFAYNKENTRFELQFCKQGKIYGYQLEYNSKEVVYEKLQVDKTILFERNFQEYPHFPAQLEAVIKNLRKNQLLLFFAQANNVQEVLPAFSWFSENLVIINTENIMPFNMELFKQLEEPVFKEKYIAFLKAADFNIVDIEVRESHRPTPNINLKFANNQLVAAENNVQEQSFYEVYTKHELEDDRVFFVNFGNESTGTQAFMTIALHFLLNEEQEGKVILIDEFNRSFHTELAEALLDLINSPKQKNQFILTSHELSLMDYNLRQDQIWFAEKDYHGETELYSIFDFDDKALTRSDFGYKKRYLEGRFGATQIINKLALFEALEGSDGENKEI